MKEWRPKSAYYKNKKELPGKGDIVKTPFGTVQIIESPARGDYEFNQIGLGNYRTSDLILIKKPR